MWFRLTSVMGGSSVDLSFRKEFRYLCPFQLVRGNAGEYMVRYNLEGWQTGTREGAAWHNQLFRNGASSSHLTA
jgi:hypothetical protein